MSRADHVLVRLPDDDLLILLHSRAWAIVGLRSSHASFVERAWGVAGHGGTEGRITDRRAREVGELAKAQQIFNSLEKWHRDILAIAYAPVDYRVIGDNAFGQPAGTLLVQTFGVLVGVAAHVIYDDRAAPSDIARHLHTLSKEGAKPSVRDDIVRRARMAFDEAFAVWRSRRSQKDREPRKRAVRRVAAWCPPGPSEEND